MAKKSEQMNAALAEAIVAQPVASVDAAVQELRNAGLVAEADELAAVLAQRQQQLAEARAAKAAEEEAGAPLGSRRSGEDRRRDPQGDDAAHVKARAAPASARPDQKGDQAGDDA
jgi:hypothetical protein